MSHKLVFVTDAGAERAVVIENLVVAGWTARDRAAVDHHIEELAAIGVPPPSTVPLYYRCAASLLTQAPVIEVVGGDSSGEVEPALIDDGETMWLGLGSDHTDRKAESYSVAISKQACAKPVARELWRFDELRDRLDGLEMASWVRDDAGAEWTLYQQGTLGKIRPLLDLVDGSTFGDGGRMAAGTLMMCGTFGAIGGVRPARHFRMELRDPASGRTLTHEYAADVLPVIA
ncbi:MAG: DUF2848 domain-containing protein [Salinarimonadaceae bacterium]|nr:MAG: DUF2848 domain-containing protein [Salinarimonadaceae bacterium]